MYFFFLISSARKWGDQKSAKNPAGRPKIKKIYIYTGSRKVELGIPIHPNSCHETVLTELEKKLGHIQVALWMEQL